MVNGYCVLSLKYTTAPFFLIKENFVYWEIRNKDTLLLNPGLFILNLNYFKQ